MTKAKTSETMLRQEDYVFTRSETSGNRDRDVYLSDDKIELHLDYDLNGIPTAATLCAPTYGVDDIQVHDEDGAQMSSEQIEILIYELLEDQPRLLERMTGLGVEQDEEEPALV
jgi:hypothetical protein